MGPILKTFLQDDKRLKIINRRVFGCCTVESHSEKSVLICFDIYRLKMFKGPVRPKPCCGSGQNTTHLNHRRLGIITNTQKKGPNFSGFYSFITKLRRNMSTVYSRSKHDTEQQPSKCRRTEGATTWNQRRTQTGERSFRPKNGETQEWGGAWGGVRGQRRSPLVPPTHIYK